MAATMERPGSDRPARIVRKLVWGLAAFLLLLPAVAMQFTREVDWTALDFVVMGAMLATAAGMFELAVRMSGDLAYRLGFAVAIAAGFLMTWINLAVGIIGDGANPGNLAFFGVLGVGALGVLLSRLRPSGLAMTAFVMTAAMLVPSGFALAARSPEGVALSIFFAAAFAVCGGLFRKAAGAVPAA